MNNDEARLRDFEDQLRRIRPRHPAIDTETIAPRSTVLKAPVSNPAGWSFRAAGLAAAYLCGVIMGAGLMYLFVRPSASVPIADASVATQGPEDRQTMLASNQDSGDLPDQSAGAPANLEDGSAIATVPAVAGNASPPAFRRGDLPDLMVLASVVRPGAKPLFAGSLYPAIPNQPPFETYPLPQKIATANRPASDDTDTRWHPSTMTNRMDLYREFMEQSRNPIL